jgi:hypothetical protein
MTSQERTAVFRHIVLFRWIDGVSAEHVASVVEGLRALPAVIPEIVDYSFGPNAGINPGTFDFGVTALFASTEGYLAYRDHPEHQRLIAERIAPFVAERAACQFEVR